MEIYSPKNSETGGEVSVDNWETVHIDENSLTKKNALSTFQQYFELFSDLSLRTKEIGFKLTKDSKRIDLAEKKTNRILKETNRVATLVYVGFIALLIVVIGIAFGYWEFIYTSNINNYRPNVLEKIDKNTSDLEKLKTCLKEGGWNRCF